MKVIDIHAHFGVYDNGTKRISNSFATGSSNDVLNIAKKSGITVSAVSRLESFMPNGGDAFYFNKISLDEIKNKKGLMLWVTYNPLVPDTERQVENIARHSKCAGIKIHPFCHKYNIKDYGINIFELASKVNKPVLTHSGDTECLPEDFVALANKYPEVKIILAHMGYSEDGVVTKHLEAIQRAKSGNIYTDTSSMKSMLSGLLEWYVQKVSSEKILFGTDSPLYSVPAQKARIEFAEIRAEDKENILYKNAAKILNLKC